MKSICLHILIAALMTGYAFPDTGDGFKFGKRPANSIFDPSEVLTLKQQKEISEPLKVILENEGIDIVVVILPEIGEAPPMHVANGFAAKWSTGPAHAVVLHVSDHSGTPWIKLGGAVTTTIKPEVISEYITAARKRAAAEPNDYEKIRAATTEAADALRYWLGGAILRSESLITERLRQQMAHEKRKRLLKLSAILGAAAAIPILFGLVVLIIRLRNRGSKVFPGTRKIARLGAPYSGGGNAVS
ncbi:MAG: TPM domain-containing protein [Armatimonadetes bacterium]|nr:TPM domain-containing protein [Akkermansiaceae bacterium]